LRNVVFDQFTVRPPIWDFAYQAQFDHAGNFTAYVTGPNHSASSEITFTVVEALSIAEFPTSAIVVAVTIVASMIVLRRLRCLVA